MGESKTQWNWSLVTAEGIRLTSPDFRGKFFPWGAGHAWFARSGRKICKGKMERKG